MILRLLVAVAAQGELPPQPPPAITCDPFVIFFDEGSPKLNGSAQVLIGSIAAAWAGNGMGDRPI